MTVKQVRDNFIQNLAENAYINMCTTEEMQIVISTLEKQIPKKPKKLTYKLLIDSGWKYECPNCGLAIGKNKYTDYEYLEEYEDYCQNCGQALDWS